MKARGSFLKCMRDTIGESWTQGWDYAAYLSWETALKNKPVSQEDYDLACMVLDMQYEVENNLVTEHIITIIKESYDKTKQGASSQGCQTTSNSAGGCLYYGDVCHLSKR